MKKELKFQTLYWDAAALKLRDELGHLSSTIQNVSEDRVNLEYCVDKQIGENFQGVIVNLNVIVRQPLLPEEATQLFDIFIHLENELKFYVTFAEDRASKLYAQYHSIKR